MAQLPTPPASRQSSEIPDAALEQLRIADDPIRSLDALLEGYLQLLDKHQKLQRELASELSSGFLSLAHANYTCPPGRRYGADYYDERMKATRRAVLRPPHAGGEDNITELGEPREKEQTSNEVFSIISVPSDDEDKPSKLEEGLVQPKLPNDEKDRGSADSIVNSQDLSNASTSGVEADAKQETLKNKKPQTSDPIRWYGLLVPSSLRSAQKAFTGVVEGNLPELASIVVQMQAAEKEICRLRRKLGRPE
ncbi:uncharacterized protein BJX67DRAFT_59216 [Aspergillus lucknowensis]|uniref:Vacuolar ATPase assembly protein VMA22 n=1 Tax=Aspergillus lucknowensis TaxID=176173 RepID=A0ABR4LV85_9EURO